MTATATRTLPADLILDPGTPATAAEVVLGRNLNRWMWSIHHGAHLAARTILADPTVTDGWEAAIMTTEQRDAFAARVREFAAAHDDAEPWIAEGAYAFLDVFQGLWLDEDDPTGPWDGCIGITTEDLAEGRLWLSNFAEAVASWSPVRLAQAVLRGSEYCGGRLPAAR